MIDLEQMFECEIRFPKRFTDVTERDYGLLFHNADNPSSYDSNHTVILRLDTDLDATVEDVTAFYASMGMKARLYPSFRPGEVDALKPILQRRGFAFEQYRNVYLLLCKPSVIRPNSDVVVRRIHEVDDAVGDLLCAVEGSDRTVRILRRHLPWDSFHCWVGYVGGRAVTMGSFEEMGRCSRVDNVLTHPEHRKLGYCSALMHYMTERHRAVSSKPLCLWANNPLAVSLYRQAGFGDLPVDRPGVGRMAGVGACG